MEHFSFQRTRRHFVFETVEDLEILDKTLDNIFSHNCNLTSMTMTRCDIVTWYFYLKLKLVGRHPTHVLPMLCAEKLQRNVQTFSLELWPLIRKNWLWLRLRNQTELIQIAAKYLRNFIAKISPNMKTKNRNERYDIWDGENDVTIELSCLHSFYVAFKFFLRL